MRNEDIYYYYCYYLKNKELWYIDLHIIQIKDNVYSTELEIRLKPREIVIFCALLEK